jgi:outer membrane receptor for ferric coprogen and ferric-rhodotorulic acid
VTEQQEPNLFAGYDREWAPGVHTLLLVARLDDTLMLTDTNAVIRVLQRDTNSNAVLQQGEFGDFGWNYHSEFDAYSAEVQQVFQTPEQLLLAGARYQWGSTRTTSVLTRDPFEAPGGIFPTLAQNTATALERVSLYAYAHRQVYDRLRLIAGVSYDRLRFPENISTPPINNHEVSTDQVSPKAGFLWSPFEQTTIRGAYTHSLGGLFYDSSVRLEPTEVAGFVQSYRSLIPESLAGSIPGSQFETASLGFEQRLETSTYITLDAELLKSTAHQTIGVFDYQTNALTAQPSGTGQQLEFEERSLALGVSQLFAGGGTVGARYRISRAELQSKFEEIPSSVFPGAQTDERATLQDLTLFARYQFPTGFFAQVDAIWRAQENHGYTPPRPREDFWQFNLFAGYRFAHRRAEVALGLLNLTGRNYRLNPLNVVSELPRQRTLVVSLKLNF